MFCSRFRRPRLTVSQLPQDPSCCILCGQPGPNLRKRMSVAQLVEGWGRAGVEIRPVAGGIETISLFECEQCELAFFSPGIVGDGDFYKQLSSQPWYYMPDKWEYRVALDDIAPADRVLEIGSGRGAFLELLRKRGVVATGLESSHAAADEAQQRGSNVRVGRIEDLAVAEAGTYDVVCHFQVLEHVPDPLGFLCACVALLKPGGRLLIATPNQESSLRFAPGALLNMPPHHQTRWCAKTYRTAAQLLDLRVVKLMPEPLAAYHSRQAVIGWLNRFRRVGYDDPLCFRSGLPLLARGLFAVSGRAGEVVLKLPSLRNHLTGHSLYGAFAKS